MSPSDTEPAIDPRLFHNLSVYQDVVIAGRTVRRGARDCQARLEAMAPHLPDTGCVLDLGSNFGWFGLRICQSRPGCVVASVEGDERSARVQRLVLQSNACRRVCLLVCRADRELVRRLAAAGQRFEAVLCLSVLHWIRDHRELLRGLGRISARIFIEQPDPREAGAGVEAIRRQIGHVGTYLEEVLPERTARCLAEWPGHRGSPYPRQLWLVEPARGGSDTPSPGLDAAALLDFTPSWPPRSWWQSGLDRLAAEPAPGERPSSRVLFTRAGLAWSGFREADFRSLEDCGSPCGSLGHCQAPGPSLGALRRRVRRVPERRLLSFAAWLRRRVRSAAGAVLRKTGLRG